MSTVSNNILVKMKRILFIVVLLLTIFSSGQLVAQHTNFGAAGVKPDASALLDIQCSTSDLFLPQMTNATTSAIFTSFRANANLRVNNARITYQIYKVD